MKYPSIEALWQSKVHTYSLATVCAAHGVSRQAFYQYQQRQATERLKQEIVLQLVCQVRVRQPNIGVRKLYHLLKPQFEQLDCQLGRDELFQLLRDHGLRIESAIGRWRTQRVSNGNSTRYHPQYIDSSFGQRRSILLSRLHPIPQFTRCTIEYDSKR